MHFCDKSHESENCNDAFFMSLDYKKDIVKKNNACFVCLKKKHFSTQCRSQHRYPVCKNRHFVILCPDIPSHKVNKNANVEIIEN